MDKNEMIRTINHSPLKIYMAVTGGGTGFIGEFLKCGGGSQTILGYNVPYNSVALDRFLGRSPKKYCSIETAVLMAKASANEAAKICRKNKSYKSGFRIVGVGATASLRKNEKEREGRWNGFHLAIATSNPSIYFFGNSQNLEVDMTVKFLSCTREEQEETMINKMLVEIYNYALSH